MTEAFVFKNGFEMGKDEDKISFCMQFTIGVQNIDRSVVYRFVNSVENEYGRIFSNIVLDKD